MRLAIVVSLCACLLAIAGSAVWVAASISRVAEATESAELLAAASLQSTAATLREARQTLDLLPGESVAWRATVSGLAQPVAASAERILSHTDASLNGETGALTHLSEAVTHIPPVLAEAQTTIAAARDPLAAGADFVRELQPGALHLVRAWQTTGQETTLTVKEFRLAAPEILGGVDRIVANSDRSTASTAAVMANLQRATKPLPTWLRIGLGVAPPLAGVASGVATTWAITGR